MRIDRAHLIAAGKALKGVEHRGDVATVKVDGKPVQSLEAAERALKEADQALEPKGPGMPDRLTRKLEHGVDHLEAKLNKSKAGRLTARIIRSDAERVTHRSNVEITFKDGSVPFGSRRWGVRRPSPAHRAGAPPAALHRHGARPDLHPGHGLGRRGALCAHARGARARALIHALRRLMRALLLPPHR